MKKSSLENQFLQQITLARLPLPVSEFRFHPRRRWRFDLAWPDLKWACEINGGEWIQGRHNRGAGFLNDCEKCNEAAILGWRVLSFGGTHIKNGLALDTVQRMFKANLDQDQLLIAF